MKNDLDKTSSFKEQMLYLALFNQINFLQALNSYFTGYLSNLHQKIRVKIFDIGFWLYLQFSSNQSLKRTYECVWRQLIYASRQKLPKNASAEAPIWCMGKQALFKQSFNCWINI